jgi:fused signal recognition particle receptor
MFNNMFNWLWSSDKTLKILQGQYNKNMSVDEKRHVLSGCNFLQEDIQRLNNGNVIENVKNYINEAFDDHKDFYNGWNEESDIKKILNKDVNIVYFFGNNGIGKTTSIVNLGVLLKNQGFNPLLIAADEFRGGAVQQLIDMAQIHSIPVYSSLNYEKVVSLPQIIFDAIEKNYQNHNVILVDTAGRSHTDINLMENLKKQYQISDKVLSNHPSYQVVSIWVNDGNIINGVQNQQLFFDKIPVNYVIMTKVKPHQSYYNFLFILTKVGPIIFYGPNSQQLSIFNKDVFLNQLS